MEVTKGTRNRILVSLESSLNPQLTSTGPEPQPTGDMQEAANLDFIWIKEKVCIKKKRTDLNNRRGWKYPWKSRGNLNRKFNCRRPSTLQSQKHDKGPAFLPFKYIFARWAEAIQKGNSACTLYAAVQQQWETQNKHPATKATLSTAVHRSECTQGATRTIKYNNLINWIQVKHSGHRQ